jgi:hypothetical protein
LATGTGAVTVADDSDGTSSGKLFGVTLRLPLFFFFDTVVVVGGTRSVVCVVVFGAGIDISFKRREIEILRSSNALISIATDYVV